ncbi:extracellular solute-binding protein [Paenibacillus sp. sptzw28]|uniref:extracellular solute-binding protein n=1 Tax=Paenibacillus sp. sptzw28 TaxID=715179 RepID=UPI001C6E3187|nr:extracellular solute-binding protein [Paenibacillus sp. sptzw28]QYR23544.1 extracellular solute-binding protein [Paenibacillus sp. sptzw28]
MVLSTQKQTKRWTYILLAGALALTSVAGCSPQSGGNNQGTKPAVSETGTDKEGNAGGAAKEGPVNIDIMLPIFKTNYPKDDSPVAAEIEKKTNSNLHLEWVPNSSYGDKFNITLASGKLPTVMYVPDVKSPSFVNAVKAGAFWEVGPYLKDYPNLSKANPIILNNTTIDGKVYGIYRGRALGRNGLVYRKDWLENLGLQEPKTIDDFYNMLKAFTNDDPDKDGKKDTYGMTLVKWTGGWASGFDIISTWFGAPTGWGEDASGKLMPAFLTPEYFEALKFMKKLYDEKLINADFAVMDSAKWTDPIVNGQSGAIVDVLDNAARINDKIQAALKQTGNDEPNKMYTDVVNSLEGPKGLRARPTSGYAGMLAISKTSVKTEDELRRILTFIDQMSEPELQTLAGYGIEGKHYTKVEGGIEPVKNPTLLESEVEGLNQMLTFIPEDHGLKVVQTPIRVKQTEAMKANEAIVVANPAEPLLSTVYSQKGAQLDNIINDARIKYVVGQIDEAAFRSAIDVWRKTGGDDLIKEMNELYAASNNK